MEMALAVEVLVPIVTWARVLMRALVLIIVVLMMLVVEVVVVVVVVVLIAMLLEGSAALLLSLGQNYVKDWHVLVLRICQS